MSASKEGEIRIAEKKLKPYCSHDVSVPICNQFNFSITRHSWIQVILQQLVKQMLNKYMFLFYGSKTQGTSITYNSDKLLMKQWLINVCAFRISSTIQYFWDTWIVLCSCLQYLSYSQNIFRK